MLNLLPLLCTHFRGNSFIFILSFSKKIEKSNIKLKDSIMSFLLDLKNIFKGNLEIELYDLKTDIQETINVAEQFPEIVKRAEKIILREHVSSEISSFKFSILGD